MRARVAAPPCLTYGGPHTSPARAGPCTFPHVSHHTLPVAARCCPTGATCCGAGRVARRSAFCMLRVSARRTVRTVTPRAPAKASRVTEVGNRLRCPASHRLSVTFERWIVSARPALLSPAKNRSRRRSEPRRSGTSRSAGASPSAAARGGSSSGRGCAAPRSHMETRSPPATPTLRASSCWVMPARSRARRSTSWSIVGPVSIATPTLEPGRRPARVKPAAASAWRGVLDSGGEAGQSADRVGCLPPRWRPATA